MSDSKKEVSNLTAVTVLLFFGVIIFWLGSFVGFTMGQRNAELVYERRGEAGQGTAGLGMAGRGRLGEAR